jgi:hypothetical protein
MTTAAQKLADDLAELARKVEALERAPRLANASIEGYPLTVNDETGQTRQTIGLQPDGTYTTTDVNGPPPPVPSLPTLEARPGTLVVTWDGKFLGDVAAPADWDHVEVHVSDVSGYTPTDTTQVATFNTLKGGSVTLALDPVAQYVVLQAVSTSRAESVPTPEVPGTPLPATTDGGIKTYYEDSPPLGLDATDDGSLWFDTNDGNHPYRWDGSTLQWLTVRDGSIAAASAAASTAQTQANTALSAAQAAQATADGAIRTYYQSNPPWANGSSQPPEVLGDLWFDTDDGQAYRWNGTTWAIIEDNSIAAALAAAQTAQTTADGKITSYYQATQPTVGELGDLWFDTDDQNKPYYCSSITPLTWTLIRDGGIAAAQSTANAALAAATTDGLPPTSSPDPFVMSGIGYFIARWDAITNADPVKYQVHISPTLGFTATFNDPTTMLGFTTGTQFTVKQLPGPDPAPGAPDPRKLDPDVTYYLRVIAYDDDGPAAQSLQAVALSLRVTGPDIAVNAIAAENIVAGTLTGELFAATVILAGTFKTADSGQRVETGIAGIQGYKADGSLMINFPTDPTQTALIDAEIIARGLTVTNGATLRAATTVDTGATVNLKRVVTAPQTQPQMVQSYVTFMPSTASLTDAQKIGQLGTFDLVPTEVTFIEFKDAATDYWKLYQIRPNGTRVWYFSTAGAPIQVAGLYFQEYADWEIWSSVEITTSTAPKNGNYRMARYIPDGVANTYYLLCPQGMNRYSRQNGASPPVVGSNGTDVYVAEIYNDDELHIRYFTPNGDGNNLSAPTVVYESTTGYIDNAPLSTVLYDANGFDVSVGTGSRYLTGYRGFNYNNRIVNTSGTNANSIFPSGSGNNWAAATKEAHSFEVPSLPRCIAWDGTNFFTYGSDGFMYKHTTTFWDPSVISSTVWSEHTFYDSDATGGTHESTPGPIKSFTWKRRSSIQFSLPPLPPGGGTDDPNTVRAYMGRGAAQPANANMWLQFGAATTTATVSLITLAGTNPPTVNNFPNATPGAIINDAATLAISGDGSIKAASLVAPTVRVGSVLASADDVAIRGPYWMGHLNANTGALTSGTNLLVVFTEDEKSTDTGAFTYSAGTLTCNRAGLYDVLAVLAHSFVNITGTRISQVYNTGGAPLITDTAAPASSGNTTARAIKPLRLAAGDTLRVFGAQTSGTNTPVIAGSSTGNLSYFSVKWAGP